MPDFGGRTNPTTPVAVEVTEMPSLELDPPMTPSNHASSPIPLSATNPSIRVIPRDQNLPAAPDAGQESNPVVLEPFFLSTGEQSEFIPSLPKGPGTVVPADAPASSSTAPASGKPRSVVAKKRVSAPAQPLIIWTGEKLAKGTDPLGQGLHKLVTQGADCAVFLGIGPPTPGSSLPQFTASAAYNPGAREALWTGLRWNAAINPEVWALFVKVGWVELTPPGTITNQQSTRNVLRGAFGVLPSEYLLMIRCGPTQACRGVIAIVSAHTLVPDASEALAAITSPLKSAA